MQLSGNVKFIAFTLGVFFLMLGAATLILSMVERIFFAQRWQVEIAAVGAANILVGATLLILCRRRSV